MTRVAVFLLTLAVADGPDPRVAEADAAKDSGSFQARISGRAWSKEGRRRIRGAIAVGAEGRLRAEILPAGAAAPLIVVIGKGGFLAVDVAGRRYTSGPATAARLERLTGLPIDGDRMAALFRGEIDSAPPGCEARASRFQPVPGGGRAPRRLRVACGESGLKLSLSEIGAIGAGDPFSTAPPAAGYEESGQEEFFDRLFGGR